MNDTPIVAVSGFMDPLHIGHLDYLEDAAKHGRVLVLLNSDEAAVRKKGHVFMKFAERKRLIEALKCVWKVVAVDDYDGTVIKGLIQNRPDKFAKGGDRTQANTPEQETCEILGIEMLWSIGGNDKPQSSSWLVDNAVKAKQPKPVAIVYEDKT